MIKKTKNKSYRSKPKKLMRKGEDQNWNMLMVIVIVSIVGFAAIIILQENNTSSTKFLLPQKEGDNVVLSISNLNNNAKFYNYQTESVKIAYFAVIGSDNNVHIAFDACDVCFAEKKGYRQNNAVMVCNNCGKQFNINSIGTDNIQGGCWPSYLPITVTDGTVQIKISDITSKKFMFE
ncbi:MAG: DUF2318 domain-containing protein [Promethearchaeota archaeon]